MALKVEASVSVNRPPADVFAVLIDVAHQPKWSKGAGKILNVSENPAILGTTWTQISKFVGRELEAHLKVTDFEANRRFGSQVDKPIPFQLLFALEPVGTGTKLTFTATGEPGGFFGVAAPLLRKNIKDTMTSDLKTLKAQLETQA
jgi:uncharacterized protein YndB with AHSA1/START domain